MTDTEDKTYRRASVGQIVAIFNKLSETLVPAGDKLFTYQDGWSDARVAEELGGDLKASHVKNVRYAEFGNLAKPGVIVDMALADRVTALEAKVEAQNLEIEALKRHVRDLSLGLPPEFAAGMTDKTVTVAQAEDDLLAHRPANQTERAA